MFKNNVQVGRGCVARTVAKPFIKGKATVKPQQRVDYRLATPVQANDFRQKMIAAGIIRPTAA